MPFRIVEECWKHGKTTIDLTQVLIAKVGM